MAHALAHRRAVPAPTRPPLLTISLTLAAALGGCAGSQESAALRDFRAASRPVPFASDAESHGQATREDAPTDGELRQYLAWALRHNPAVRSAHAGWEASVHRISRARRLPEPMVSFGVFLRAVETRVGPQRARLGVQQTFPWPTKLSAGADAGAAASRAAARRLDALTLRVAQQVETAYWKLWEIRHTRTIHEEHLQVIRGLSETVLARVATGVATLADQQQVDLIAARLEDRIRSMDEAERAAEAQLRAAVGLPSGHAVPTSDAPPSIAVPEASLAELEAQLPEHPLIDAFEQMAQAQESRARAEAADALPSFTVGADWIITGEARMPGVADSGDDALVAGVGVRVPLWQDNYDDSEAAARAEAIAERAQRDAAVDAATAQLHAAHASARDTARQEQLYANTLLPQADSSYASVLGAYTAGRGTVAQTLLAQRDLLELRVELERARAQHATAWALLEQVVGQPVQRVPYVDAGRTTTQPTGSEHQAQHPAVPAAAPPEEIDHE